MAIARAGALTGQIEKGGVALDCSMDAWAGAHPVAGAAGLGMVTRTASGGGMKPPRILPIDWRMAKFTDKSGGPDSCWLWTGKLMGRGYGMLPIRNRANVLEPIGAHRLAWMLANGGREIPAGMMVRHTCDVPRCVNPTHLILGTHRQNMADMVSRGRQGSCRLLTEQEVREVRVLIAETHITIRAIGRAYGVHANTIHNIRRNTRYQRVV